ncbi:mitochondrial 54S ribosomal protein uL14m [Ascoidea rubescens DSM 1968]|uniref:Large ribosomal subunit protein uL14m n=1 Tax=Ascoidea rubescens DSM 1968 TaxID=1344418 RepID=A0A1D2VSB2_9ASCO|nr:ribosomal protein L14 [Ascoidea rubescens DSM 1968]ODV64491.1 ribosomal protein L14 [Ascoidea rubescens DSM 1968]
MIYLKTMLKVIDNSGAQLAECIKVMRKSPMNCGRLGDRIVVVIQKAKPISSQITGISGANRVKRGDIVHAVIVRQRQNYQRKDGSVVKFDDNACVLINKNNNDPIGTRIGSCIAKEVRMKNYNKIAALAPKVL